MRTAQLAIFSNNLSLSRPEPPRQNCLRLLRALASRGHQLVFYQPDPRGRRENTEHVDHDGIRTVRYPTRGYVGLFECLEEAAQADVIVKVAGLESFDGLLDMAVLEVRKPGGIAVRLDANPHDTLDRLRRDDADPLLGLIPEFDLVLVAGGLPLVGAYKALGARDCFPMWSALAAGARQIAPPDAQALRRLGDAGAPITPVHIAALERVLTDALAVHDEAALPEVAAVM